MPKSTAALVTLIIATAIVATIWFFTDRELGKVFKANDTPTSS